MDLRKQFTCKNDEENKRFCFDSIDNSSCSYTVDYYECDNDEHNAWIGLYKAKLSDDKQIEIMNKINK